MHKHGLKCRLYKVGTNEHSNDWVHTALMYTFPLSLSVEDILDEVSGLTVESPDQSMEEGSRLTPQSPGDYQEDKTCMGTGQKVGYGMQRHSFQISTNSDTL